MAHRTNPVVMTADFLPQNFPTGLRIIIQLPVKGKLVFLVFLVLKLVFILSVFSQIQTGIQLKGGPLLMAVDGNRHKPSKRMDRQKDRQTNRQVV